MPVGHKVQPRIFELESEKWLNKSTRTITKYSIDKRDS
jgi:hypothetical protein